MAADLLEISDQSGRGRAARVTNKQVKGLAFRVQEFGADSV